MNVWAKVCCNCQIVEQCNEGARKMSNLEQMMEIDRVLNFKSTKVQIVTFTIFYVTSCTDNLY